MRTLPAWSVIGRTHVLSDCQVTVAVVALPVSSTSPSGEVLLALLASFQLLFAITPAVSLAPIAGPLPTNLMLIAFVAEPPDALTARVTVAVCVSAPLVPVIVNVELPASVLEAVVTVSVEFPLPLRVVGLKAALAPIGRPLTLNPTEPLKLFSAPTVVV